MVGIIFFSWVLSFDNGGYLLNNSQYGLELVFVKNSHEFVNEYLKRPEFAELMHRLGALGDGSQDQSMFIYDIRLLSPSLGKFVVKKSFANNLLC